MHPNTINSKDVDFQSLDPYSDLDQDDKSLTQFRISKKDFVFLRNLGEKRGVLQTCAAILIKGLVEECHKRGIEDYTHLKQFGELVLSYGPYANTNTDATRGQKLQPSSGGTVTELNGQVPNVSNAYGVKGTGSSVENLKSISTDSPLGTDGRIGPVGDGKKPKRSTKKKGTVDAKPTTKGKTRPE